MKDVILSGFNVMQITGIVTIFDDVGFDNDKNEVMPLILQWDAQKAKLKTKFPKLTEADLNFDETRKGVMLSKLQVKTGRTAKELQVIIETL